MAKTRVEEVVGRHALRTIQSADDDAMYVAATAAAMYMATAGFLEEANGLLGRLWSYNWPHSRNCWLADRGLEVLWYAAGSRPSSVPFAPQPIDRIELAHRVYMAMDAWAGPLPTRPWQVLNGLDLLRRSMHLACPPTDDGPMPSQEDELEALAGLDKYLADIEPIGWIPPLALCLAAELAARNGRAEQATHYAVRWAEGYPTFWANCVFECMACNRHMAPLLLQGILAAPLRLTAESCRRYLEALLAAVNARMKHGRTLVYGAWSWPRLLAAISKQAIAAEPDMYTPEERRSQWIGRAGASEAAIAAAEARLRVQLPPDYLEFVRASNGLSPVASTSPRLLPIEEIDYLRHVADPEMFDIYKGYPGDDMPAAIESCILASDRDAEEMVLLIPPLTAGAQWQTWFFAHWVPGEIRYPSFRHYMEETLQDPPSGS
jgi:hypothetical protein